MILFLLAIAACDFSAATDVLDEDTAGVDTGSPSADDTGGGGGSQDTADSGEMDPDLVDDDGDGWTEADGDCDDDDATVAPGVTDACNGADDDCDDEIDEDARGDDEYEDNDETGYSLGSLHDDASQSIEATLHNDDDVDRFTFWFEDSGWGLFNLEVGLSSVPDGATFRMVVENTTTGREYFTDYGSGSLEASIDDTMLDDEGGTWQVTIDSLGGADCSRRYLLSVSLSD